MSTAGQGATTADPNASSGQRQATPGSSSDRTRAELRPNAASRVSWNEWGTQWTKSATSDAAGDGGSQRAKAGDKQQQWTKTATSDAAVDGGSQKAKAGDEQQPWWRKRPRGKKEKKAAP